MNNLVLVQIDEFLSKQRQFLRDEISNLIKTLHSGKEPEEVLQTKDVCELLKKSRQTIENWCDAGIIKKRYLGESVFFLRSEIISAMREINPKRKNTNR